jgi:hypothetical protein
MVYKSIDEVKLAAENGSGAITLTAGELRDAYGYDRLGKHVRAGISAELRRLGLASQPTEIPDRQDTPVRVFIKRSPVGRLIAAATTPSEYNDLILQRLALGKADSVLEQIRKLVTPQPVR